MTNVYKQIAKDGKSYLFNFNWIYDADMYWYDKENRAKICVSINLVMYYVIDNELWTRNGIFENAIHDNELWTRNGIFENAIQRGSRKWKSGALMLAAYPYVNKVKARYSWIIRNCYHI